MLFLILAFVVGSFVLLSIELALYLAMVPGYYLAGPTVAQRRHHCHGLPEEMFIVIRDALAQSKLRFAAARGRFFVRRPWYEFSSYPRTTIRFEGEADGTTVVVVEVKPFLTAPLFIFWAPLFEMARPGFMRTLTWGMAVFILLGYAYFFTAELQRMRDLDEITAALDPYIMR